MFIITKTEPDDLMPDVLCEDNGSPILFKTKAEAMKYMDELCNDYGVTVDLFMLDDNIEIKRVH